MDPTVLVIDDTSDSELRLDVHLKGSGVRFLHATGAEEGVMLARTAEPDLVLLDVDSPGTDGVSMCERLKGCPETWSIPIIFLSRTADTATKVRAFDCGAVDYVTKPFEAAELRARMRTALRIKQCHDLLATQVRTDLLTGLWSRVHFESRLEEELAVWKRFARQVAVVLIDIDASERLDEDHGDRAVQAFATALRGCLRKTDTASRYGAAQFAVILRETGITGAAAYARRLRRSLESLSLGPDELPLAMTASMGVVATDLWDKGARLDVARMLARADFAVYNAKHGGCNRVELATAA